MGRFARLSVVLSTTLVILVGFTTLIGLTFGQLPYRIPDAIPLLGGISGALTLEPFAQIFVRIAVIVTALTIIIGVMNLFAVNVNRILKGNTFSARLNSMVVIASFMAALLFYINTNTRSLSLFLLENVQVPIESALAGLLFFVLVYGGFHILRDRITPARLLFVITVELVLIGALVGTTLLPIQQFSDWLMAVPVTAGARGILLGIALATLVTGLRVLIGQDRTYGE